nr:phage portal protein [uncultured Acidocella sp.]
MGIFDRILGRDAPKPRPARVAPRFSSRMYSGAILDRLTADWVAQGTSQDAEVFSSLRALRNRSRQLIRDNDYARNAKRIVMNNVAGPKGIRMQARLKMQRGDKLADALNQQIEAAWRRWCKASNCDASGKLSFAAIQRMAVGGMFESGEILVRLVRQPFGRSKVPLGLELIESDQLIETQNGQYGDNMIRMGVEVDRWRRPQGYWLYPNHPGDVSFQGLNPSRVVRLPANEIIHLFIPERPTHTRGVPWLHSTLKRLHHLEGFEESEVVAARASAALMGFIEEADPSDPLTELDNITQGQPVDEFSPGMIKKLAPGEKFNGWAPQRAHGVFEPFMRSMLRGMCAGLGISYASISKDSSQSNYSSSRLDLLEEREMWKVLQDWLVEHFNERVFEEWLFMAVMVGEVRIPGFELDPDATLDAIKWRPRGWSWVDPEKDVSAAVKSVRSGFKTLRDVIEEHGGDYEETLAHRKDEVERFKEDKIVFDTDPSQVDEKGMAQKAFPTNAGDPLISQPVAETGPDVTTKPQQVGKQPVTQPGGPAAGAKPPQKP